MMSMQTSSATAATVQASNPPGNGVEYGKLAPLRPEDLKAPEAAPKHHVQATSDPIDVREVIGEMQSKLRQTIVESSVSGILVAMRASNLGIAALMFAVALAQMITEDSFWSAVQDVFSVFYTFMFAIILTGYELRTARVDLLLRENFGFMYGPRGRCLFLCLISVFPLGMVGIYGVLVSLLGFSNAYFNYFVITKHPSFTRGIPDYEPPVVGTNAENEESKNSS